jgi:hypothetical protein
MILSEEQVADYSNDNAGYCKSCDDVTNTSGVEPDTENYICEVCGKPHVMGIEQAVMLGRIVIEEFDIEEE